jgi:chloramphenicol 3-O-phosphotransferase
MNPIFLIAGSPAVGKSTTSRALAGRFARSLHVPVDDIRHMVVSGLIFPDAVGNEELIQQLTLARASVAHMALAYHAAGFAVVVDDYYDPDNWSGYADLYRHPSVHRIVLYPAQEEAHRRNERRSGESPARVFLDEGIRRTYEVLNPAIPQLMRQGWVVVDTTTLDVEATATLILQRTRVEI